jgi:hypothetical protein
MSSGIFLAGTGVKNHVERVAKGITRCSKGEVADYVATFSPFLSHLEFFSVSEVCFTTKLVARPFKIKISAYSRFA